MSVIDVARHRIIWRYGTPGTSGSGANQLANPDDALMLSDGSVLSADIKNCRIVLLRRGSATPVRVWGEPYHCHHLAAPLRFGSPNGAFPLSDGHYLVTEITNERATAAASRPAGNIGPEPSKRLPGRATRRWPGISSPGK